MSILSEKLTIEGMYDQLSKALLFVNKKNYAFAMLCEQHFHVYLSLYLQAM